MTSSPPPMEEGEFAFRPIEERDLPQLRRWLLMPHVRRWWDPDVDWTDERIRNHYLPLISGADPTAGYIIVGAGREIGYIQTYRIADHPHYARSVNVCEPAAGIDLYIGEAALIGRGLGTRILPAFLRQVVLADPAIERCTIGPQPENLAAIRAFEKAGFRYLKAIHVPGEPAPEYLMAIGRAEALVDEVEPVR
jgi:RimJ/RimL family protein N-acetyltransferase